MNTIKSYFTRPETIIGLGAALIFQLVFIIVWLTAYHGVTDRTENLKIGISTNDPQGIAISEGMKDKITAANIVTVDSLQDAQDDMNEHKLDMVIHIPDDFSETLMTNEQPEITYYINQSTSMLTVRVMEKIATSIGTEINSQVFNSQKEA